MNVPKAPSRIRHLLLCAILGTLLLTGSIPAHAVTYTNNSPLSFVWGAASGTVDHYNVYVSVDGQPFELLEQVGVRACQFEAEDGRTYVLQVEAEDPLGRVGPMSDPSDQVVVFLDGSADDTDGDGMTDTWEATYGLNPFDPSDADGDLDGDGATNLEEFNSGSDPTDSDSDDDGILDGEDEYPMDPLNGNSRPVADAGEDQELDPGVVTLDGSGSYDPDGDPLSFLWIQGEGPEVDLSDTTAENPTFQGFQPGEYVFTLVVNDGSVVSFPDSVSVTIRNGDPNDTDGDGMPNAWETEHGLNPLDPNDADGDLDGDGATNLEEFNSGSDPTDPDSDDDGIPDGQDEYPMDPLNGNTRPVADAGEDQELDPTVVTLDGSGSHDADGDLLSYTWTQQEGPEVELSDEHVMSPAFLATKSGAYLFELVVSDGSLTSLPAEVTVTIRNVPPAADAGEDVEVDAGTVAVLDGSGSADPNEDPLSYAWSQTQGIPVVLDGANNPTASFFSESQGIYVFQLVTFDGSLYSSPDEVQVTVNAAANNVPTADAGDDKTVTVGDTVALNGSGSSDLDGDTLSYAWSQVGGPETVVLEGAATVQAQFEAPEAGIYEFQLVVNDGQVDSAPDGVTVTVETPVNQVPVAVIEPVDPVEEGDWVILDGSGSYDPDQDSLTYTWAQFGGPQAMIENGDQAVAGFYAVTEGTLTFELVVHDGEAASTPASVQVQVLPGDDPPTVDPPSPPRKAQSGGGGGCSVGLGGSSRHETGTTDIGYLLTLFLPAIGALLYQKRRFRRQRG